MILEWSLRQDLHHCLILAFCQYRVLTCQWLYNHYFIAFHLMLQFFHVISMSMFLNHLRHLLFHNIHNHWPFFHNASQPQRHFHRHHWFRPCHHRLHLHHRNLQHLLLTKAKFLPTVHDQQRSHLNYDG